MANYFLEKGKRKETWLTGPAMPAMEEGLRVELSYTHIISCARSVSNRARVFRTRDLCRGSDGEADAVVAEEGGCGAGVAAQVEVDVCAVLVRAGEAILGAERVSVCRAEVVGCGKGGSISIV